ncbi:Na(+)/H(+) antiporter subunit B [Gracilibacillus marinus]|jgi:multicomponent Na+:H+ antiporter subunit B|uniref:Na(+)/H(+) antiporter subunit B n=1 Tax=Gracilibacillus marinus TaxID=630535 RepID=A0ABV8VVE2_9BACI
MVRTNDLILRTMTVLIAFILFGFSVYIFLSGHNAPGGGFIGGLMTSAGIILMYMAYGYEAVNKILPINYRYLIGIGLLFAIATAIGSFMFGQPFLSHTFDYFHFPIFGEVELATATLFDIGVYFTVIGVALTIVLTISEDQ